MYATVQKPKSSARMFGIVTAAMLTLGAGWVFSEGIRDDFMPKLETRTELVMIEQEEEPLPLPVKKEEPIEEVKIEKPELVAPPDPPIIPEEPVITAPPAPDIPVAPAPVITAGSDRVPPKLVAGEKPQYPAASLRAAEEGTTHLEVCVNEKGRVQSVTVAQSSGHPRLDEAAAKWLRNERFRPGTVGGVAQPVCGHDVYYQWSLENA